MIMNYIQKIKANISIYSTKKTSNILDGTYKSIYKGKSMNFEDLREYVIGDNVKDIDWKASARTGNILIKQFIAEKKHNIMLVLDTGKKMLGDTQSLESKKNVTIITAGTIAYLANKNGDYVGAIYSKNNTISFYPFKSDLFNIEKILSNYDKDIESDNKLYLNNVLEYLSKNIKKRMIIFVITDINGMERMNDDVLKKISTVHDVLFINISDAYMTGDNAYDIENSAYIPKLFLQDNKLYELERKMRDEMYSKYVKSFSRYRISTTSIGSNKEITPKIIELLERHKYANIR